MHGTGGMTEWVLPAGMGLTLVGNISLQSPCPGRLGFDMVGRGLVRVPALLQ